jgi:hypothetical protein
LLGPMAGNKLMQCLYDWCAYNQLISLVTGFR